MLEHLLSYLSGVWVYGGLCVTAQTLIQPNRHFNWTTTEFFNDCDNNFEEPQSNDAIRQIWMDPVVMSYWKQHCSEQDMEIQSWDWNRGTDQRSVWKYILNQLCSWLHVFSRLGSGYAMPPRSSAPVSAINLSLLFQSIQRAGQRNALSHTINLGWTTQAVAHGFMAKLNEPCRQLRQLHRGHLTAAGSQTSQVAMGREDRLVERGWGSERWEMFPKN